MLLTLSEAARLLERKRGKKVHWSTLRRWGQAGRFRLHFANGWKVCETEFINWASKAGKLRKKSGGGIYIGGAMQASSQEGAIHHA